MEKENLCGNCNNLSRSGWCWKYETTIDEETAKTECDFYEPKEFHEEGEEE